MTEYGLDQRWQENRAVWRNFWQRFTLEQFGITMTILAFVVAIIGYITLHGWLPNIVILLGDFYANVSSELLSIVITVGIVDRLNRARDKRERNAIQQQLDQQELTRLTALLGSNENVVTKIAVAELRTRGWLQDGSLQGADLWQANLAQTQLPLVNLSGTDLWRANLSGTNLKLAKLKRTNLTLANLEDANMERSYLEGAFLRGTTLVRAYLRKANLSNAFLSDADLTDAILEGASMRGATLKQSNLSNVNLRLANLQHANMFGVICNEDTTLPDGTTWTPNADWSQFGAVQIENNNEWQAYRRRHGLLDEDT